METRKQAIKIRGSWRQGAATDRDLSPDHLYSLLMLTLTAYIAQHTVTISIDR